MKRFERLEIVSGFSALIFAIIDLGLFLRTDYHIMKENHESILRILLFGIAYDVFPALMMAIGTLIHFLRRKRIGFFTVIIFGILTLLTKGFTLLLINSFYDYGRFVNATVALSILFAMLTMLFTILSRKS